MSAIYATLIQTISLYANPIWTHDYMPDSKSTTTAY